MLQTGPFFKRLARERSGATLIEFAIVFPLFLLIIFGILEFSVMLYLRGTIEEVTRSTARLGITGSLYGSDAGSRGEFLEQRLKDKIQAVVLIPGNVEVGTRFYDSFSDFNADGGTDGLGTNFGGANQVVRYTVTYEHEFITPLAVLANGLDDTITLTSTTFAQNEAF